MTLRDAYPRPESAWVRGKRFMVSRSYENGDADPRPESAIP
jgi:hypothetical protein